MEDAARLRARRAQSAALSTAELITLHQSHSVREWDGVFRAFLSGAVMKGRREAAPAQRRALEVVVTAVLLVAEKDPAPRTIDVWEHGPVVRIAGYTGERPWAAVTAMIDPARLLAVANAFHAECFRASLAAYEEARSAHWRTSLPPVPIPQAVIDAVHALWRDPRS